METRRNQWPSKASKVHHNLGPDSQAHLNGSLSTQPSPESCLGKPHLATPLLR